MLFGVMVQLGQITWYLNEFSEFDGIIKLFSSNLRIADDLLTWKHECIHIRILLALTANSNILIGLIGHITLCITVSLIENKQNKSFNWQ